MRRFVLPFAVVGAALPVTWLAIYHLIPAFRSWWYGTGSWTGSVLVAIWPSSMLLLGDPEDKSIVLPLVAIGLNAVLYAVIGALLWIGLRRRRAAESSPSSR